MFVPISNTPRPYAWGSTTAIAELLGSVASGGPEAELWLGAHPGSPSRILDPSAVGGARDLDEWIDSDPATALGGLPRLPFLMKVLAATAPLSLQAHPTAEQARLGFERENALGIPLDAPHRNYRDAHPKPEIIYALSETFDALCGFRPIDQTRKLFEALGLDDLVPRLASLPALFEWLMTRGPGVDELLARVVGLTKTTEIGPDEGVAGTKVVPSEGNSVVLDAVVLDAVETMRTLSAAYPGDAGVAAALLLNRVTLKRGEALYLPAGNIHAYLSGLGIEVMTASDNVLRGGLTTKHVDVPELLKVLDFRPGPVPYIRPELESAHCDVFRPGVADFVLAHVTGGARYVLSGPGIAICTAGRFTIDGGATSATIARGESVYVTPDEAALTFTGTGELFLATTGRIA